MYFNLKSIPTLHSTSLKCTSIWSQFQLFTPHPWSVLQFEVNSNSSLYIPVLPLHANEAANRFLWWLHNIIIEGEIRISYISLKVKWESAFEFSCTHQKADVRRFSPLLFSTRHRCSAACWTDTRSRIYRQERDTDQSLWGVPFRSSLIVDQKRWSHL